MVPKLPTWGGHPFLISLRILFCNNSVVVSDYLDYLGCDQLWMVRSNCIPKALPSVHLLAAE